MVQAKTAGGGVVQQLNSWLCAQLKVSRTKMPYHSFALELSLLFPALSPFVLAAAEAKVDEKGEGIVQDIEGIKSAV